MIEAVSQPGVLVVNPDNVSMFVSQNERMLMQNGNVIDLSDAKYAYFASPGKSHSSIISSIMIFLETCGISCIPGSDAYRNSCSKFKSHIIVGGNERIPILPTMLGSNGPKDILGCDKMVSKPDGGTLGRDVRIVYKYEPERMTDRMVPKNGFILQKYAEPNGTRYDLRIIVYDDRVLCAEKRFADIDFRTNLSLGNHGEAYEPTKEEKDLAIEIVRCFKGLVVGGVDLIYDGDDLKFLEVNPFPGDKICEITGINFYKHIIDDLLVK